MRHSWLPFCLAVLAGCAGPAPLLPAPAPSVGPLLDSVPSAPPSRAAWPGAELIGPILFYEDFEAGLAGWEASGGAEVGWRLLESRMCGGAFTMLLGREGEAPFSAVAGTAWLTRREAIDLTGAVHPWLKFDVLGVALPESGLRLSVEVRPEGGEWTTVGPVVSAGHERVRVVAADLGAFAGKRIGLRFRGDVAVGGAATRGMYLDEVRVIEPRAVSPAPLWSPRAG